MGSTVTMKVAFLALLTAAAGLPPAPPDRAQGAPSAGTDVPAFGAGDPARGAMLAGRDDVPQRRLVGDQQRATTCPPAHGAGCPHLRAGRCDGLFSAGLSGPAEAATLLALHCLLMV